MQDGSGDSGEGADEAGVSSHQALARLDREWSMQREQYMIANRYGRRYVPTPAASILTGSAAIGFGLVWTVTALKMDAQLGGGQVLASVGILLMAFGLFVTLVTYRKARRYQAAYEEYRRRRQDLLALEEDESE
jgi:hypothetical protein